MSAVRPRLSIDVGTLCTSAALDRGDGNPVVVELGSGGAAAPSTVALADGQVVIGDAADVVVAAHPERGVRELKRRFGDTTPVVLDGQPYTADALTAEVLRSVARIAGVDPGDATVVLTHPAGWHEYKRDLLAATGARAGFADVEVVSEAEAAVRPYANSGRLQRGNTVAVYDLGGTFEVSLVAITDDGLRLAGTPQTLERLGGDVLDQVVFRHVTEALGGTLQQLDRNDPAVRAAIATLRTDCTAAKERLSSDGETSIPVVAPGLDTRVRMTRDEFETAVRPLVTETLMALDRALASAGLQAADLTAVVLVGGGSQVPVVAEMVAGHLGRPALTDDPRSAVVLGAVVPILAAAVLASAPVAAAAFPTPTSSSTASEPRENPMTDQPAPENAAPAAGASTGAPAGGAGGRVIPTPPPAPGKKVSSRAASVAGGLAAAAAAITAAVFYGDDVVDAFDGPDGDANAAGIADAAAAETRTADRAEREATPDDSMDAFDDAPASALAAEPATGAQGAAVGTPLAPPAPQQEAFDRPAPQRSHSQQQQQQQSFDDDGPAPATPRQAPAAAAAAATASGAAAAATAGAADAADAAAAPAVDAQFEASRAQLLARLDRFEAPEGTSPEDAQALKDELRETIENFDPRPGQTAEDALTDLRSEFDDTVQDFTQDQRIDALIDEVERDRAEDAAEDAAAPDPLVPPVVDPAAEVDDDAVDDDAVADDAVADDAVADDAGEATPDEVVPGPAGDADGDGVPDHVGPARDLGDVIAPPILELDPNLLEEPPRFDPSVLEDGTLPRLEVDPNSPEDGDGDPAPEDAGGGRPAFADAQLADTQLTDRLPDRSALLDDGFDQLTTIDVRAGLPVDEDPDAGGEITRSGIVGDEAVPQVRMTAPEGVDRPTMMADLGDDTYEGVKEAAEVDPAGILIGMDTAPTMQDAMAATPIVDLGAPLVETELLPAVDVADPIVLDLGEPIALDLETEDVDLTEAPGLAEELHNDITPQAPDNLDFGG